MMQSDPPAVPSTVRINAFLSQAGVASRRGADELIKQGKVKVNGTLLHKPGAQVDPFQDRIEVLSNGKVWTTLTLSDNTVIYAVYKPRGYVTSMRRQGKSPIIRKLVPNQPRVFPVGRLDKESEGLILMTNDGALTQRLIHPRSHVEKSYIVHCTIPRRYTENQLRSHLGRVAKGVRIDGRKTLPSQIALARYLRPGMVELHITLREGRHRQIRKMLGTIHLEVVRLIRVGIGKLSLEQLDLDHGEYVQVKETDIV